MVPDDRPPSDDERDTGMRRTVAAVIGIEAVVLAALYALQRWFS